MLEELKVAPTLKIDEAFSPGDFVYVSLNIKQHLYEDLDFYSGYALVLDKEPKINEYLVPTVYKMLLHGKIIWCVSNEIYEIYSG